MAAGLSAVLAGEEVAGVKLHARLGRQYFHDPAAHRFMHASRQCEITIGMVEHEVVIVTTCEPDLFVIRSDAGADHIGRGEIKRRAGDGAQFTGWNQSGADRREA